jgi:5-methylthioadenosine/S-adenosylhomocysteine deaminase
VSLVVTGRVVPLDGDREPLEHGAVYIDAAGQIAAVTEASAAPPAGFEPVEPVAVGGTIYPGLIDLHNHLAYNALPLWAPAQTTPFRSKSDWSDHDPTYKPTISDPANALCLSGKALLKYVEVKALVGGTTAIQGSAKMSKPYDGWLCRNVEYESPKSVYQSVLPLHGPGFDEARGHMDAGMAYLYHLSEGTDPALVSQFTDLETHDCVKPELLGIHSTALGPAQFAEWAGRGGGTVVWSPFSNLWLYGATTDVVSAAKTGLRICLGSDWSPSGSKHVLGELKVADLHNRRELGGFFSDRRLCEMVTSSAADALGWQDRVGRLKPGLHGDLVVVADSGGDPYRNLVEATERDIRLVVVGGRASYGLPSLMRRLGAEEPEPIRVGGRERAISLIDGTVKDADMTWAQVISRLEERRADPNALAKLTMAELHAEPQLIPEMPGDAQPFAELAAGLGTVSIPPLDALAVDHRYLETVEAAKIPGGALAGLAAYY